MLLLLLCFRQVVIVADVVFVDVRWPLLLLFFLALVVAVISLVVIMDVIAVVDFVSVAAVVVFKWLLQFVLVVAVF